MGRIRSPPGKRDAAATALGWKGVSAAGSLSAFSLEPSRDRSRANHRRPVPGFFLVLLPFPLRSVYFCFLSELQGLEYYLAFFFLFSFLCP